MLDAWPDLVAVSHLFSFRYIRFLDGYAGCFGWITLPFPIDFPFVSLPDASARCRGRIIL